MGFDISGNTEDTFRQPLWHRSWRHARAILGFLSLLFFFGYGISITLSPPDTFQPHTYIDIPKGYTLEQIATLLKNHSVIRSPLLFMMAVRYAGSETNIESGAYLFKEPIDTIALARRFASKDHDVDQIKITFPEGITVREMASILSASLSDFDKQEFEDGALAYEGYLFPDTYFFYTTATSGPLMQTFKNNFRKRTKEYQREAESLGEEWSVIIIIASLLEKETIEPHDRRIVSGIIRNRLKKDMPLQIDATLGYITGKASLELTQSDLQIDSPLNTYKYRGLPPKPIGNPGIDTIDAALHPKNTPYLYYLSDKTGKIHYAKTFEEHKLNKARYLR